MPWFLLKEKKIKRMVAKSKHPKEEENRTTAELMVGHLNLRPTKRGTIANCLIT